MTLPDERAAPRGQLNVSEPTPGPWKAALGISETDALRCGVTAVRGKTEYLIATIENGAPGDFCETEAANARLIAAAPEMYAALVAIQEWLMFNGPVVDDGITHPAFVKANNATVAALAAARGALEQGQRSAASIKSHTGTTNPTDRED